MHGYTCSKKSSVFSEEKSLLLVYITTRKQAVDELFLVSTEFFN